jgi:hypothetical protein
MITILPVDERITIGHWTPLAARSDNPAAQFNSGGVRNGHGIRPLRHFQIVEQRAGNGHRIVQVFKTDNFVPTGEKLVVTASDPDRRIVHEFNAGKAAEEFASAVGILPDQLTPMSFASHPVVVRVGGEYYCRSIQKVNADGSLSFFCAIDDGIVLSIAQPRGMVESTRSALRDIRERLGGIDVVLGFDCVLRRLDARNRQLFRDMSELYRANNVIGFGTYGEQYRSMHLNQTLTGIAFGSRQ